MSVGKEIRMLRKGKDWTQGELAKQSGLSLDSISRYEKGERSPTVDQLEKIAQALGVSINDILDDQGQDVQQPKQKQIESNVLTMNDAMMIPIVTDDVTACCGDGTMYAEEVTWNIVGHYPMDSSELIGYTWRTNDFCIIKALGDSMEPHIHDGDRVLFVKSPDVEVASGDFAIVLWNERLLIRAILFEDSGATLRPTNDMYGDIKAAKGDERLCILGKVLGVVPAYRKMTGLW